MKISKMLEYALYPTVPNGREKAIREYNKLATQQLNALREPLGLNLIPAEYSMRHIREEGVPSRQASKWKVPFPFPKYRGTAVDMRTWLVGRTVDGYLGYGRWR